MINRDSCRLDFRCLSVKLAMYLRVVSIGRFRMWLKVDGALGKSLMVCPACEASKRGLTKPFLVPSSKADVKSYPRDSSKLPDRRLGNGVRCEFLRKRRTV